MKVPRWMVDVWFRVTGHHWLGYARLMEVYDPERDTHYETVEVREDRSQPYYRINTYSMKPWTEDSTWRRYPPEQGWVIAQRWLRRMRPPKNTNNPLPKRH